MNTDNELIILIFVSKEKNVEAHSSDPLNLVVTINTDVLLFGCLDNLPWMWELGMNIVQLFSLET